QTAIKAKTDEIAAFLRTESARWSESAAPQTGRYMVATWTLLNRRKADSKLTADAVARAEGLESFFLDRWSAYLSAKETVNRPYLSRWRQLLASQDPKADLSGDAAAKAEVAEVASAFQDYVIATLSLRDALKRHGEAAAANS